MSKKKVDLTPAMVKAYVASGGARCPYCGSDEIEAGPVEADGDSATGPVECHDCGEEWRDVFLLGAVDVLDENGRYADTIEPGDDGGEPGPAAIDLDALFQAADAHAAEAGDQDYALGDLQEILRAAWRVMTADQIASLHDRPELAALSEIPEYRPVLGRRPSTA
jgi:hypothetical protein